MAFRDRNMDSTWANTVKKEPPWRSVFTIYFDKEASYSVLISKGTPLFEYKASVEPKECAHRHAARWLWLAL